jgi:type IV secretory pathway VirD2 relaxase
MPTRRGEILEHGDQVEPALHSTHLTVRGDFVQRALQRRFRTPLKQQHPRGVLVRMPGPKARQAVVKVWQPSPKTTSPHLSYLTRDGAGEAGHRAELFTADGRTFDRKAFVAAAKDDPGQYRLMVSVQDHQLVHLPTLTRALMQQVEQDVLQAEVAWVAAVHGGEHPHVHLLMRGVDATGQEVHFTHDYRLRSLRYQAQTLLTRWLGEVEHPADIKDLDTWAEAHLKETQLMLDPSVRVEDDQPMRPRTLTTEEAHRRLEETRQRLQQTIGRLQARGQEVARAKEIEPETLQHQPGEPEHSQPPDQQSAPSQGMDI